MSLPTNIINSINDPVSYGIPKTDTYYNDLLKIVSTSGNDPSFIRAKIVGLLRILERDSSTEITLKNSIQGYLYNIYTLLNDYINTTPVTLTPATGLLIQLPD